MGFFKKLFKKRNPSKTDIIHLEQDKKQLFEKYQKKGTLLKPHKSDKKLSFLESKFGGEPNLNGFEQYPCCDACNNPLNFVLQLYKKDFADHYFPNNKNLFQLYRCPNFECPEAYSDKSDLKTFIYYFSDNNTFNKELQKPLITASDIEAIVPDCFLKPTQINDFPDHSEELVIDDIADFEKKYGYDKLEDIHPLSGTKSNGYPSYEQYPEYPMCFCGKEKEFFFQLSSEDLEEGVTFPPSPDKWSPHGIMIGDVGNIYFYVCKSCGEDTIESNWDCG